jgi:hypothetical protein
MVTHMIEKICAKIWKIAASATGERYSQIRKI